VGVEDLLQGHLAVQFLVQRDEDRPQAAAGVGPEDAEPLAVGGGRADGVAGGPLGVAIVPGRSRADAGEGDADVGVADAGQFFAGRAAGGDRRQAPLGIAMLLDVQGRQRLDRGPLGGVEVAQGDEVIGQRPALVAGPGPEGVDELVLVDQGVLQGEDSPGPGGAVRDARP
jgi:hypothetical protein